MKELELLQQKLKAKSSHTHRHHHKDQKKTHAAPKVTPAK
jgi:hypothetical protein